VSEEAESSYTSLSLQQQQLLLLLLLLYDDNNNNNNNNNSLAAPPHPPVYSNSGVQIIIINDLWKLFIAAAALAALEITM